MANKVQRLCTCGQVHDRTQRCPTAKRKGHEPEYRNGWRAYSLALRQQHIARYGNTCPGTRWCGSAHPSDDLVVDHDFGVMCRTANSRKANTFDRARRFKGA